MKRAIAHPSVLLINPPIYDFAAYDLWAKPIGLLSIASLLLHANVRVHLLDCLDRLHPSLSDHRSNRWGCGKYPFREIAKPKILRQIPRKYKRYGLPESAISDELSKLSPPDVILVTSGMTYWYPGVFEVIETAKKHFPHTPVMLGGIYATLCTDHARRHSGADYVVPGPSLDPLIEMLGKMGIILSESAKDFNDFPPPHYGLYNRLEYASIRTTRGCPYRCSYCAVGLLSGKWERKTPERSCAEIKALWNRGVRNFAFYDDGLLVKSEKHFIPLLEQLRRNKVRAFFHSPNGIHARQITPLVAKVIEHASFIMPRLSLETADPEVQRRTGGKVTNDEFLEATTLLKEAGYRPGEYAAYLMIGMPEQKFEDIEKSIRFAHECGARVFLAEYSPIPGTKDWEKIKGLLPSLDPLWHNNSLFPLYPIKDWQKFNQLKLLSRRLNNCFT